jgi:hypothetical protein
MAGSASEAPSALGRMLSRSGSKATASQRKACDYQSFLAEGSRPNAAAAAAAGSYRAGGADSAARQAELVSAKRRGRRAPAGPPAKSPLCSAGCVSMYVLCVAQICVAAAVIGVAAACLSSTAQTTAVVDGAEVPVTTSVCYGATRSLNTCYWSYIARGGARAARSRRA